MDPAIEYFFGTGDGPTTRWSGTADLALGGLGVVGPTRMDYPSTMASVRAVARYVGRFLSEG